MKLRKLIDRAEDALDSRTEPSRPGDRKHVPYGLGEDSEVLKEENTAEASEPAMSSGPPHLTSGQWKGLVIGGLVGGVIGAVLLLPLALVPFLEPATTRVVVVVIIGAIAGATASAVYWGGRMPELEGETIDVDGRPSSGTSLRTPGTDDRGRPLRDGQDDHEDD